MEPCLTTLHHLFNDATTFPCGLMESPRAQATRFGQLPRLPVELILYIIECVPPPNQRMLVPTWHISTKTLLSLTQVSRATYGAASTLLRQRCLYVDSSRRLEKVLLCMPRHVATLRQPLSLRNVTSLYLAPFGASLDDLPTATGVRELLCEVCETLRRLVIHMPFSTLDVREDQRGVKRTLRDGFEQLCKLEEFACIGEYPTLSMPGAYTDVWLLWPELQRLLLFDVPAGFHWLWWDIATLPRLQHVVLARAKMLETANIKDQYFNVLPAGDARLQREMRVVLLDVAYEGLEVPTARWAEVDPKGLMTVQRYEVPRPFYGDETMEELVTEWTKRGALDGSLWEWEGQKLG